MTNEPEFLTRRRFIAALAASVVAAGASLPVGMPTTMATYTWRSWDGWESMTFAMVEWQGTQLTWKPNVYE